jgi:hypothetical protein
MATKPTAKLTPAPPPPSADPGRPDPDQIRAGMEQVRRHAELFLLAQRLVAQAGGMNEAVALVELVPLLNEVSATMAGTDR